MTAARITTNIHLKHLNDLIKDAESFKDMVDKKRFLTDKMAQHAICHSLMMMIESALTIGQMIIATNDFDRAEKNDEIFEILADKKIITRALEDDLSGIGGFRNILAHNYVTLDLNRVYINLEKSIPAMKKYSLQIAKYLRKN